MSVQSNYSGLRLKQSTWIPPCRLRAKRPLKMLWPWYRRDCFKYRLLRFWCFLRRSFYTGTTSSASEKYDFSKQFPNKFCLFLVYILLFHPWSKAKPGSHLWGLWWDIDPKGVHLTHSPTLFYCHQKQQNWVYPQSAMHAASWFLKNWHWWTNWAWWANSLTALSSCYLNLL